MKLAAGAAGAAVITGGLFASRAKEKAKDLYRRLVELDRSAPGGDLSDAELAVLLAAARTLLGDGIDERRYDDLFRWKARNAGGYHALYRRFARDLDRAAGSPAGFAGAPGEVRAAVMERAAAVRRMINADDALGGLRFAILEREWLLYERYIVRELLTLFSRTDAWLLAGYGPHPGVPRGLEAYRRAPATGTGGGGP